ncbi:helix-turn-helix domain-containing protein [Patescibacteria group bacterium]
MVQRQGKNSDISYILFFTTDFLHPTFSSVLGKTSTFLQNIYFKPLFSNEDGQYFVNYLKKKWNVLINPMLEKQILEKTARNYLTLKQAVRFIRDKKAKTIDEIFSHDMMQLKLKYIYDNFLESEKTALIKITQAANDFDEHELASIDFLKKVEWLGSKNHRLQITVPIVTDYLKKLHQAKHIIKLDASCLVIGNVPIDSMFSKQERAILELMVKKQEEVLTRDEIAYAIWKDAWREKYSDWAIDQIISRIRKKVTKLNLPKSIIKAVKGKGFVYGSS